MKKIILFFFLIINLYTYSQLSLENSLSGIYSKSNNVQFNFLLNGNNTFTIKRFKFESNTNYQNTFSPKLESNELGQRLNVSIKLKEKTYFTTYQFGYSLARQVKSNNLIGLGLIFYQKSIDTTKSFSSSYAILYQNSISFLDTSNHNFRHSLRMKAKYVGRKFVFNSEYFYQPNLKNYNDYTIFGNTKLTIPLKNWIGLTIQDNLNYNSISSIKLIHTITMGFEIKYQK